MSGGDGRAIEITRRRGCGVNTAAVLLHGNSTLWGVARSRKGARCRNHVKKQERRTLRIDAKARERSRVLLSWREKPHLVERLPNALRSPSDGARFVPCADSRLALPLLQCSSRHLLPPLMGPFATSA